jgi:cytochrome-b5 reductase
MRVTFATIGLAGLSIFGMYKLAGPDSDVAEHVGLIFNPYSWTQSMITATHDATPNTKLITLAIPRPYTPKITDKYRPIWHIYVKDDDIMVERPYTPLTGFDVGNQMQLWVKRYDQGEVGRWLHDKDRGNTVEVRGPVRTWSPPDEDLDEIVFVCVSFWGLHALPFHAL